MGRRHQRSYDQEGILKDWTKFHDCASFQHDGVTCLLFPFADDVEVDIGKLALWRLSTHANFGGTWLSDFVENQLGGFVPDEDFKPDCPMIGQDGNIFNLMGIAARTLRENDMEDKAKEMCERIYDSGSYDNALCILGEYVNITAMDEAEDEGMGMQL